MKSDKSPIITGAKGNTARKTSFENSGHTRTPSMFDGPQTKNTLFQCETRLTPDYMPEEPIGREHEIEEIANAVRPLIRKKPAENLLVHGPAGAGKTTTVKHVMQQLEEESSVKPVCINCWQYNTRSSLLSHLLIELGFPTPRKGRTVDELILKLEEWLDKNRSIALVLDEFDQLRDQNDVVYDFKEISKVTSNEIGLILVSNKPPKDLALDARSESRLSYRTLHFQPYDKEDIRDILKNRARHAFNRKSVSEEVFKAIAEITSQQSSDCRQALAMLLAAGRKAEQEHAQQITLRHIDQEIQRPAA